MSSDSEKHTMDVPVQKKKTPRAALRVKASGRQPGRPHKRLPIDILQARSAALTKKLAVLQAKKTLLADRLEAYAHESSLREADTTEA